MNKSSLAHASVLGRVFRRIVLTSIVIPAASAPVVIAWVGGCAGGADEGESSSGTSASSSSGSSSGGVQAACSSIPTDAPVCGAYSVSLTGNLSTCEFDADGTGSYEYCRKICAEQYVSQCKRSGGSVLCSSPCAVDGRRYSALDDRSAPFANDVGSYLARMAFFEAASIDSFALLERELTMHHAPSSLVRSCARARRDETRHARMAMRLAERHGGCVVHPPSLQTAPARALEEIAIENAVEGCVRETFGVLIGMWQAEHAPTRELRAFFVALTSDEARHAALASRIDGWILQRLSPSARHRVEAARAEALDALVSSFTMPPEGLGLPTPTEARSLFDQWRVATSVTACRAA